MTKITILFSVLFLFSCTSKNEGTEIGEEKTIIPETTGSDTLQQAEPDLALSGDSALYYIFKKNQSRKKVVYGTQKEIPLKPGNQFKKMGFEFDKDKFLSMKLIVQSNKLVTKDGTKIEFIRNVEEPLNKELIFVNGVLFSERKLLGEMFERNSDFNIDYSYAQLYKNNKNQFLIITQPSTWCGLENQCDFYQLIDLTNKEVVQFSGPGDLVK